MQREYLVPRMSLSGHGLRQSARTLAKHPGFACIAILSLALAIALNTTMYSVLDAMINPRIDAREPERLFGVTYFGDYRRRLPAGAVESALLSDTAAFEAVTGYRFYVGGIVEHGARYHEAWAWLVKPNYFGVLGTHARAGRLFAPGDELASTPVVIVSDRLAAQLFTSEEQPVGARVDIEGNPFIIIGIVGRNAGFTGLSADAFVVASPGRDAKAPFNIIRLRAAGDSVVVRGQFKVLAARLAAAAGDATKDSRFAFKSFAEKQFHIRGFHYALIGAVFAVLLVACANLANLQLARGIGRARELALRAALGASRAQIIQGLLAESALLAVAGLALGLVLTYWSIGVVGASIPPTIAEYVVEPQTSWRMLVFAVLASVLCLLFVGLVPAIQVSRVDPNELLKAGAGTGMHRQNRRRYGVMIVAQIALSLALLSGASLVLRTAWRVAHRNFGFDAKPLVKGYALVGHKGDVIHVADVAADVVTRARAIDGVAEAAVVQQRGVVHSAVTVDDASGTQREIAAPLWGYSVVTPGYLRTYAKPIVQGRDFQEGEQDLPSVIVDRETAKYLWPGVSPIGRLIKFGDFPSKEPWSRVVGVVGSITDADALEREDPTKRRASRLGAVYRVFTRSDTVFLARGNGYYLSVVARARRNPEAIVVKMRRLLIELGGVGRANAGSMEDQLGFTYDKTRHDFVAAIFTTFALLGLGLAAMGVYGIVSHSVAERRRELGVRIALGATSRDILRAVLREGNVLALAGVALGLYLTKRTVLWLSVFYGEDDQHDAHIFALMAAILFAVTVIAALVPAWRATRVDPVESLRND